MCCELLKMGNIKITLSYELFKTGNKNIVN